MRLEDRVTGCFQGLSTGDAIGKQTETLTRQDVLKWYPAGLSGFHGDAGEVIPRYSGKRYEWRIGETTDDTEQTLAVARALLAAGAAVSHEAVGRELLRCRKSVHPDVSIWALIESGDPAHVATRGDGCGAAMRAAPVGVIFPTDRLNELVRAAYECSLPTHGGELAICAAASVAGAVSAALEGQPRELVLDVAVRAARTAEGLGASTASFPIADAIATIYRDLLRREAFTVDEVAQHYFPKGPTIVPLAIALALVTASAEETALFAANLGGDADSVASIGGAIAGAMSPASVNQAWVEVVHKINGDPLGEVAEALAARRGRR